MSYENIKESKKSPKNDPWARPTSLQAFGTALRRHRAQLHLTLDALAITTGISKPYLSNIETARAPGPPSEDKLRRLASALSLNPDDLLAAADWLRAPASIRKALLSMGIQTDNETPESPAEPRRPDGTLDLDRMVTTGSLKRKLLPENELQLRSIPLINRVAAGKAAEFTDLNYPAGIADAYIAAPDLPEASLASAFVLRVVGNSMLPDYREGDILIVAPTESGPQNGQDCVVRLGELDEFATTFKRIFVERDTSGEAVAVRLVPLNPVFPERRVELEQVTGIYPLMYRLVPAGVAKEEKELTKKPESFTSTRLAIEND